jgi:hypothetical protein
MLDGNTRWILFFDLAMTPHPSDAIPIPLRDVINQLKTRVDGGVCMKLIDRDRRALRINEMKFDRLASRREVAVLLFSISDLDAADPTFQHIKTGKFRTEAKKADEGGAVTVHAVVELDPVKDGSHVYRMAYEDVVGLGRTRIEEILRSEFKAICEGEDLRFRRVEKCH